MTGMGMVNIALGMAFVYTLFALLCSVLNEWISRLLDLRRSVLQKEVKSLLGPRLAAAFNSHPLIKGMHEGSSRKKRYPLYMPPSTFALAFIDVTIQYRPGQPGMPGSTELTSLVSTSTDDDQKLVNSLRLNATNLEPVQRRVEKWFELSMEHATGVYKRHTQIIVVLLAFVVAAVCNVDTIRIATSLYAAAIQATPREFPIGGPFGDHAVIGITLSALAISLGAPFWFDMLNKLVNLRQTGLPPDDDPRARAMVAH